MLKPSKLSKVRLVGLTSVQARTLALLRKLGVMQIESHRHDARALKEGGALDDYEAVSEQLVRVRAIKGALSAVDVPRKRLDGSLIELAQSIQIEGELLSMHEGVEKKKARIEELKGFCAQLERLRALDVDYHALPPHMAYFIASVPARQAEHALKKCGANERCIGLDAPDGRNEKNRLVLIGAQGEASENAAKVLKEFEAVPWPAYAGTPRQALLHLAHERSTIEEQIRGIERRKAELSQKYYPLCARLEEELALAAELSHVAGQIGRSSDCFWAEGWVRPQDCRRLENEVARSLGGQVFAREMAEEEHGGKGRPTLLENPDVAGPVQYVVNFLSVPKADEIDPTMILFITIPAFYGMIVGDAGYALISFLLAWAICAKAQKGGMLYQFSRLWMLGAVPSLLFGVAFDEYFGFSHKALLGHEIYKPLLERANEMSTLLLITIIIGWAHLALGFVLGAINEWEHSRKHAYAKLAWLPIMAGGTMAVGCFLLKVFGTDIGMAGAAILAFGIAVLVWAEGPLGVVEVPGVASNVMSYTRIAAVGMAGLILAEIINRMLAPDPKMLSTPQGILTFLLIGALYVLAHAANTVIAMVESTIHGARLNVVEFFGKFYHGGGQAFVPLAQERKYTLERDETPPEKQQDGTPPAPSGPLWAGREFETHAQPQNLG